MKSDLGVMLPGGKTGVLLLHDVGGSAAEQKALAQALARCGYTVHCPQLIGLGQSGAAGQGSAGMLVSEAEQALSRLRARCEAVVVIGIAYGGMLALELGRHNAGAVQAVAVVEPRAWLPSMSFAMPAFLSGRIKQTWLAALLGLIARARINSSNLPAQGVMAAAASGARQSPATLLGLGKLLDSVHAGLPSVRQPVLMVHKAYKSRRGHGGSFMLQRRLGGRVESVMIDDGQSGSTHVDRSIETLAERCERFIAAVIEEIEIKRGNEARRQKVAAGRTTAA